MRTTLNIDDALMAKVRRSALARGVTITRVFEEALAAQLSEPKPAADGDGFELPTWDFGAIAHGVDVSDRVALYDQLDDERTLKLFERPQPGAGAEP